jgi:RNA polymerase sigma-70 factor, ECF subfamily
MGVAPEHGAVTTLLHAWERGDPLALERLLPLVIAELRRVARGRMARERDDHTLQPTALIHEVYLRLAAGPPVAWRDRAHFFALAARLMRHVLVDHARARGNQKRGGRIPHVPLDEAALCAPADDRTLLAFHDALDALGAVDPRRGQVVELRVFGGLSVAETADVLRVSPETVMRDWKRAKAWLARELRRVAA